MSGTVGAGAVVGASALDASPAAAASPVSAAAGPPPAPAATPRRRLRSPVPPLKPAPRAWACACGRPAFFQDSACAGCGGPLGYDAARRLLLPLEPAGAGQPGRWREAGGARRRAPPLYRRCAHLDSASGCNWLVDERDRNTANARNPAQCRSCRLTRTLPALSIEPHALWWRRIEVAKRRLVASLIALGVPVAARVGEDPRHGLAFDLLRAPSGGPRVVTGHVDGVITIDVEEADDATRERRRNLQAEPHRTVLGHLRHETGHYYWQRLVDGGRWLAPYRALFGDERQPYRAALRAYYDGGPPRDWQAGHVSAYASCHPWEDWAETWAHYLHLMDALETARSLGLDDARAAPNRHRFDAASLAEPASRAADDGAADAVTVTADGDGDGDADGGGAFVATLNGWTVLTGVLNELARSRGSADPYPYALSEMAARKLRFVHRVVCDAAARR